MRFRRTWEKQRGVKSPLFFDIDRLKQPHKHLLPAVRMLIIPREAHIVRGEVNSHPAIMSLAFHERLWHEVGEADTLLLRSRLREMSSASDGVLNGLLGIYWQASAASTALCGAGWPDFLQTGTFHLRFSRTKSSSGLLLNLAVCKKKRILSLTHLNCSLLYSCSPLKLS